MSQTYSPKFINYFYRIILLTAVAALGLTYFFNLNTLVSFGGENAKIKKEIKEIDKQNQNLMTQIASRDELAIIQEKALALKMEKASETKYMIADAVEVVLVK